MRDGQRDRVLFSPCMPIPDTGMRGKTGTEGMITQTACDYPVRREWTVMPADV